MGSGNWGVVNFATETILKWTIGPLSSRDNRCVIYLFVMEKMNPVESKWQWAAMIRQSVQILSMMLALLFVHCYQLNKIPASSYTFC